MTTPFRDHADAAEFLTEQLNFFVGRDDVVVLALPGRGTRLAHEVAVALAAPLDVLVVRPVEDPGHPGVVLGTVAAGGARLLHAELATTLGVGREALDEAAQRASAEVQRLEGVFRGGRSPVALAGHTAILVEEGLADASAIGQAVAAARELGAKRVIVATPVACRDACDLLRDQVDELICVVEPEGELKLEEWYVELAPLSDEQVGALLKSRHHLASPHPA